jgi:transposase InsO family protein
VGGAQKRGASVKPLRQVPQFFERAEPNALWQTDLVEDEKTAFGTVHGVFFLDDYSRECVGGRFFATKAEEGVLGVALGAINENGVPLEVLSDNGSQFRVVDQDARVQGARTRYELGFEALGTKVTFAGPHHPQTKGKEERFNRFVIEDFLNEVRDKAADLPDLNAQFERWRQWYNEQRPHSALGFKPPKSRYRVGLKLDEALVWQAFAKEETRRVQLTGKVQVGNQFFQLPGGWERSQVRIYRLAGKLKIVGGKENRLLGEWQV